MEASPYCIQLLCTTSTTFMDMAGFSSRWKYIYCIKQLYTTYIAGTFPIRMEVLLFCIQLYVQLLNSGQGLYWHGGLSLLYTAAMYSKYNLFAHGRMFLKMEVYLLYTTGMHNLYRRHIPYQNGSLSLLTALDATHI